MYTLVRFMIIFVFLFVVFFVFAMEERTVKNRNDSAWCFNLHKELFVPFLLLLLFKFENVEYKILSFWNILKRILILVDWTFCLYKIYFKEISIKKDSAHEEKTGKQ